MEILIRTNTPQFFNDISESIRAFYPEARLFLQSENEQCAFVFQHTLSDGEELESVAELYDNDVLLCAFIQTAMLPPKASALLKKRLSKRAIKLSFYYLLKKSTSITPPWGALTGIRPTKIVYDRAMAGEDAQSMIRGLREDFDLPEIKSRLLMDIVDNQKAYMRHPQHETDIYLGIPFCVSRCIYCSFASALSLKHKELIAPYMEALKKEIRFAAELLEKSGRNVRCIYIGGGTPTALPEQQLQELLQLINTCFAKPFEFTVEAGRPDTITHEKLMMIKNAGADRISINPQTMNDSTLEQIGRKHTAQEITEAFALARSIGFKTINADVIAGLPGENISMFEYTLEALCGLKPENITVHTLSLKKGSILAEQTNTDMLCPGEQVQAMVEGALKKLQTKHYKPYYLYRQKYMAGNLENVGYTLDGHTGIYNIDIMEETTDILALGAGAISKRVFPDQNRIERAPNVKSITEYIERIDEMLLRKDNLFK